MDAVIATAPISFRLVMAYLHVVEITAKHDGAQSFRNFLRAGVTSP